jgi:hypothetical protein
MIALPFLTWGYTKVTLQFLLQAGIAQSRVIALLIGSFMFVPIWFISRRRLEFFATMEHELTHLVVGCLFLKIPRSFHVDANGTGSVHLLGSNFLITLAPYFLPTISFLMLPIALLLRKDYVLYFIALLGLTVAYHLFSTYREISLKQPDIQITGILFSILFLTFANIICYGSIIAFTVGDYTGFKRYWVSGFIESYRIATTLLGL